MQWLQGFADQAMSSAETTLRDAAALGHQLSLSLCLALAEAACPIAIETGDFAAARRYLTMLSEAATQRDLPLTTEMAG